jgi:hypothetical protein
MKTATTEDSLTARAAEALRIVLGEVSSFKLMELQCVTQGSGGAAEILALVDVFGRSHTLTCAVKAQGNQRQLMTALRNLRDGTAHRDRESTIVMIAPYLSPEAQAFCKESDAGFLDLEGNARIAVGEVFISKRTMLPYTEESKSRPSAPMVYIASNIPGSAVRASDGTTAGTAVA